MPDPVRSDRWKLVAAYLPLLGLIPLFFGPSSREVRWHARNGLLLSSLFLGILFAATIAGLLVQSLSCLYGMIVFLAAVVYLIVMTLGIVKALQGHRLIIPGLSRYADRN